MKNQVNLLESRQHLNEKSLANDVDTVRPNIKEKKQTWLDRIIWNADFRYCHEMIDKEKTATRHRLRTRATIKAKHGMLSKKGITKISFCFGHVHG